jgi:hypothetical protein
LPYLALHPIVALLFLVARGLPGHRQHLVDVGRVVQVGQAQGLVPQGERHVSPPHLDLVVGPVHGRLSLEATGIAAWGAPPAPALHHHVLDQVAKARTPRRILRRSEAVARDHRDQGDSPVLDHQEGEAVRQAKGLDGERDRGRCRRGRIGGQDQNEAQEG